MDPKLAEKMTEEDAELNDLERLWRRTSGIAKELAAALEALLIEGPVVPRRALSDATVDRDRLLHALEALLSAYPSPADEFQEDAISNAFREAKRVRAKLKR